MTPTPTEHPVQGEVSDQRAKAIRSRVEEIEAEHKRLMDEYFLIFPAGVVDEDDMAWARGSLLASGVPAGEPIQHHPSHPAAPSGEVPTAAPFSGQHAIGGGELPARLSDAQIEECFAQAAGADEETHIRFARAIEAAHGIGGQP